MPNDAEESKITLQTDNLAKTPFPSNRKELSCKMYYDESNNFRKLYLNTDRLDIISDNKPFVLGGIALRHEQNISIEMWEDFIKNINLQKTAKEIKFKHLAQGNYEKIISSEKISKLLDFLLKNNILIHYSILDPMYWSIVDIVEDVFREAFTEDEHKCLLYKNPWLLHELKNEFYMIINNRKEDFFLLIDNFDYPNISRQEVEVFFQKIIEFINKSKTTESLFIPFLLNMFESFFESANFDNLVLIYDNKNKELIDNLSYFYNYCISLFPNSEHIFDRETQIEDILRKIKIVYGDSEVNYKFIDSHKSIEIQLSDLICGLLAKHFSYIQNYPIFSLQESRNNFNQVQLDNLFKLGKILSVSRSYSPEFLHYITPLDTIRKNEIFLTI